MVLARMQKVALLGVSSKRMHWYLRLYSSDAVLQVLHRLLPWDRGLFEDYVANFWCTTSLLIKWKKLIPMDLMPKLCAMYVPHCTDEVYV